MAPEQMMSAKDVDARADIYAMGVILYHSVGGRVPFESDNIGGLCMKVLNETPVPLEQIAPVPLPFAAIVMRCLAKQREGRFNDVGELAVALAPFGSADAAGSAMRITKVLRRTAGASGSSAAIAMTLPASQDFRISHPTPTPAPGSSSVVPATVMPDPRQPISTIGASSGESMRVPSPFPAKKSRWPMFAAIGAVAVVGVVAIAMTRGGGANSAQTTQPDPIKDVVKEPPPAKDPISVEPKPVVVDQAPPEVKPDVKPATPEVTPTVPEVKPTKPTIATKPITKPVTKPSQRRPPAPRLRALDRATRAPRARSSPSTRRTEAHAGTLAGRPRGGELALRRRFPVADPESFANPPSLPPPTSFDPRSGRRPSLVRAPRAA